jgi:hypothetical protein
VDLVLLTQTAGPATAVLGVEKVDVVADKGYLKIEDIEACEKAAGVLYSLCIHYRPPTPWPEKGWISSITTKFGTCYTSEFEARMQRYFFVVWITVFIVAFVL